MGAVWAVGAVRAEGGLGTHWKPLNTSKTLARAARGVGSVRGWRGGGGERVGAVGRRGFGHKSEAFKYSARVVGSVGGWRGAVRTVGAVGAWAHIGSL